jgi:hypothetical protein
MSNRQQGAKCPSCDSPVSGNFCKNCGEKLGGSFCNQCGSKVSGKATFCNQCGTQVGTKGTQDAGSRRAAVTAAVGGSNLPWWIAGVAMFGLILVLGLKMVGPAGPTVPAAGPAPVTTTPGQATTDISQMSPLEAADRLFRRVMTSASQGDSASAIQFAPMAIASYERARPLSLDGLFHLSTLNRTIADFDAAIATALEVLEQNPNHLLGLTSAAEASVGLGQLNEAAGYYQTLVDVYDAQMATPLQEYLDHSGTVDALKADAEAFLAGR